MNWEHGTGHRKEASATRHQGVRKQRFGNKPYGAESLGKGIEQAGRKNGSSLQGAARRTGQQGESREQGERRRDGLLFEES